MTQSFEAHWQDFEQNVIPNASPIQRREMKKAFFAGGIQMIFAIAEVDEDASDEEGAKVIEAYKVEIEAFFEKQVQEFQKRQQRHRN